MTGPTFNHMQRIFFLTAVLFLNAHFAFAQNHFSLTGKIKGVSSGYLYLYYTSANNTNTRDSSEIKNDGSFSFAGNIEEPCMSTLLLKGTKDYEANRTGFFLEPGGMTAT